MRATISTMSTTSIRGRVPRRIRWVVPLVLVLAFPATMLASDQFGDVPDSHIFHAQINSLAGAGITAGCGSGQFCPEVSVTRGQMAGFLNRGLGRATYDIGFVDQQLGTSSTDLAVIVLDVPGVAGQTQFVLLNASVTSYIQSEAGCPCSAQFAIEQDGVGVVGFPHATTHLPIAVGTTGAAYESASVTAVVAVPSGTVQTFYLIGYRYGSTGGTVMAYGELSAITAPFGSTGGNTP